MRWIAVSIGAGVVLSWAAFSYAQGTPATNSEADPATGASSAGVAAAPAAPAPIIATPPTPVVSAPPAAAPAPSSATVSANVAPVMAAPTSPAFDAIGATPTTIAHPISMRAMGATLLSYIDKSGHVNAGVALEAAPIWLLLGDSVTLRGWRGSYAQRAMSRLTLSFASAANASGVTSISQGLRFVFWDDSDPRWDTALEGCLASALKAALPNRAGGALPDDSDTNPGSAPVVDDAAVKSCQDQAKARGNRDAHDASSGAFSSAVTEQQDPAGKSTFGKFYGWLSASKNFGSGARWVSLLGSLRYVYDNPGDEMDAGLRIRVGGSDLGISVDGAWTPVVDANKDFKGKAGVVGLNGELRLSDTLWVTATAGGKFGADSGGAPDLFSVLHVKFATESTANITPSP